MKALREEFALVETTLGDLPAHTTAEIFRVFQPLDARITAESGAGLGALEYIATLESKTMMIEATMADLHVVPPGFTPAGGVCSPGPSSTKPWRHSPPVVSGTPGQPGSSGASDPSGAMRACMGGRHLCHCMHVKKLMGRVDTAAATFIPDPWARSTGQLAPAVPGARADGSLPVVADIIPLKLSASTGSVGYKDRTTFGMKMPLRGEYKFNGDNNGPNGRAISGHTSSRACQR